MNATSRQLPSALWTPLCTPPPTSRQPLSSPKRSISEHVPGSAQGSGPANKLSNNLRWQFSQALQLSSLSHTVQVSESAATLMFCLFRLTHIPKQAGCSKSRRLYHGPQHAAPIFDCYEGSIPYANTLEPPSHPQK